MQSIQTKSFIGKTIYREPAILANYGMYHKPVDNKCQPPAHLMSNKNRPQAGKSGISRIQPAWKVKMPAEVIWIHLSLIDHFWLV